MKRVLIADDDSFKITSLKKYLPESYEVVCAQDGRQALEELERGIFDAAVLDWEMPPEDLKNGDEDVARQFYGGKVAQKAVEINPDMVIVMNTTVSGVENYLKYLGINAYCPGDKGFLNISEMNELIMDYLKEKLGV